MDETQFLTHLIKKEILPKEKAFQYLEKAQKTNQTLFKVLVENTTLIQKLAEEWVRNTTEEQKGQQSLKEKQEDKEQLLAQRYQIIEKLGEGGFGIVQLVYDQILKREVALKTIKSKGHQLSQNYQKMILRFQREAEITAILEHPNIVPLYDYQDKEEEAFQFTMRKVDGKTLRSIFQEKKESPESYEEELLLSIFLKVCDAVAYAHSKGVIHRDLKPENIMVGEFGEVYVMDWGIAKRRDPASVEIEESFEVKERQFRDNELKAALDTEEIQTKLEKLEENFTQDSHSDLALTIGGLGTVGYMSPEQSSNASNVTIQSDIYSLGQILKEIYTTTSPIDEIRQLLGKAIEMETFSPQKQRPSPPDKRIPLDIEAIVHKAKAIEQENRYRSVEELAKEVRRYQRFERVQAREHRLQDTLELTLKWLKRNKERVLLVFVAFFLLIGFQLFLWLEKQQEIEKNIQEARMYWKEAEDIKGLEKQVQSQKVGKYLESYNAITAAYVLSSKAIIQQEVWKIGERLAQISCESKNYQLAFFIANALEKLPAIKATKKEQLRLYVLKERDRVEEAHLNELEQIQQRFFKGEIEKGETEDILFVINQMPEERVFQKLLQIFDEGVDYFLTQKTINPYYALYYQTIIKALGRLGNKKATKHLLLGLKQFIDWNIEQKKKIPVVHISMLATITAAIANLDPSPEQALDLFRLRDILKRESLYGSQTQFAFQKLTLASEKFMTDAIQKAPQEAKNYQIRGNFREERKAIQEAIQDYTKAIELDPSNPVYFLNRGNCWQAAEKFKEAIADYNKVIQLDPKAPSSYVNRANVKTKLKEYQAALKDYQHAIKLDPTNSSVYVGRASLKVQLKKYQEATKDFTKAIQINPSSALAYNNRGIVYQKMKQFKRAIQDHNQAILLKQDYTKAYIERALAWLELNETSKSLEDLNKALELEPQNLMAYQRRGVLKEKMKQYESALEDYSFVLKSLPNDLFDNFSEKEANIHWEDFNHPNPKNFFAILYLARGTLKLKLKQTEQVLEDFNRAILLDPYSTKIYLNRGLFFQAKKQYKEALKDYNKAVSLESTHVKAYQKRSEIKFYLKDYQGAVEDLTLSIQYDPKSGEGYHNRGILYLKLRQPQKALDDFSQAIFLNPKRVEDSYFYRAKTKLDLSDFRGAIEDYSKACQINPNNPDYFYYRGTTYANHLNLFKEAFESFQRTLEIEPYYLPAVHSLAMIHLKEKKIVAAIEYLKRVHHLSTQPGFSQFLSKTTQRNLMIRVVNQAENALANILINLVKTNYRAKKYQQALYYLKQFQDNISPKHSQHKQVQQMIQKLEEQEKK